MPAGQTTGHLSLGRAFLSALLAFGFLAAALLSSSPCCHETLHPGNAANHVCLVTLSSGGHYDIGTTSFVLAAPVSLLVATLPPTLKDLSLSPVHYFSLLEHAPPAAA
ncbi:MAG: hypothetical protein ACR2G0_01055 [Chthoniobacterales bacterium]